MRLQKFSQNIIDMKYSKLFPAVLLLLVFGCKTTQQIPEVKDDGKITFKFVQVNDVYEIAPLSGGKYGGMARVAHVVDSIKNVEPNTYLFMAGDFLNPSLLVHCAGLLVSHSRRTASRISGCLQDWPACGTGASVGRS